MEPEQRAAAIRAMANMSDIERKNFMDMVNFGTVINKEGATAQAMSAGLTDPFDAPTFDQHSRCLEDLIFIIKNLIHFL